MNYPVIGRQPPSCLLPTPTTTTLLAPGSLSRKAILITRNKKKRIQRSKSSHLAIPYRPADSRPSSPLLKPAPSSPASSQSSTPPVIDQPQPTLPLQLLRRRYCRSSLALHTYSPLASGIIHTSSPVHIYSARFLAHRLNPCTYGTILDQHASRGISRSSTSSATTNTTLPTTITTIPHRQPPPSHRYRL